MKLKKNYILLLLLSFVCGIVVDYTFQFHWIILFTIWVVGLIGTLLLSNFGKDYWSFRKWISIGIIFITFMSGMLGYSMATPDFYDNNFESIYLEDDYLSGVIEEYQRGQGDYDKAIISLESAYYYQNQRRAQGKLLVYIKHIDNTYSVGDVVLFHPTLHPIQNKNNPGEFDAEAYWKLRGITYMCFLHDNAVEVIGYHAQFTRFWDKSRSAIIQIINKYVDEENRGLAIGLTLGDKSSLTTEEKTQFSNAGAMHVLAVSGMHVGILLLFIQWIFKQIRVLRKRNVYLLLAIAILWCFAFLTGMSASVLRAVLMFSILAIGQIRGEKVFSLNSIFASALFLLIYNPLYLFDIGFQLSYLAVIGISLFFRPIAGIFTVRNKIIRYFWEGTALGFAAQIGTLPFTLYYFHQFPNYFILTNLGVLVMASAAMISVVILCLLFWIPYLNSLLGWVVDIIFSSFSNFIKWINELPAVVSTGFTISVLETALLYLGVLSLLFFWDRKKLHYFRMALIGTFLLCCTLIFQREYTKLKEELVIFNNTKRIISYQYNKMLYVFYDANETASEQLDFVLGGYKTQSGCEIVKIAIDKGTFIEIADKMKVSNRDIGLEIQFNSHRLLLPTHRNKELGNQKFQLVKGEWSRFLDDQEADFDTKEKALIIYR